VAGGRHSVVADSFGHARFRHRVIEGGYEVMAEGFSGDRVRDWVVSWRRPVRDAATDQQRIHGCSFDLLR
jgi:hypothetical protein